MVHEEALAKEYDGQRNTENRNQIEKYGGPVGADGHETGVPHGDSPQRGDNAQEGNESHQFAENRWKTIYRKFIEQINPILLERHLELLEYILETEEVELLEAELSPYRAGATDVRLVGPGVWLDGRAFSVLALVLHELATNAAKYGALSNASGSIEISWSSSGKEKDAEFVMTWIERDGPPVSAPERTGFGSVVTTKMVKMATGGDVVVDYPAEGLNWKLTCPVGRVLQG